MSSALVEVVLECLEEGNVVDHGVDEENGVCYTTIRTNSTLEEVKTIIRREEMDGFGSCNHQYDCCGCYFLSMVFVLPMFQDQKDYYLIKEVWSRNV